MTFNPKVSIVIPVFNGSDYLKEAIDSALNQTYKNIEVLVINDGSNDNGKTEKLAKSYNKRIRYFYKENGGVSSALNLGIKKMRGEYFSWLSHDDYFSLNRIEEDMNIIRENLNVKITFCKIINIDEKGEITKNYIYPINKVTNPKEAIQLGGVDLCAMTIHKSCFYETCFFNEKNKTMQDVEMSLCLSRKYIFFYNENVYVYKRHHQKRGTILQKKRHKYDQKKLMNFIYHSFSSKDFFPELKTDDSVRLIAYKWMAKFFSAFKAYKHADKYYKRIYLELGERSIKLFFILLFGSKIINSNILNKIKMYIKKIINKFKK